MLCFKKRVCVVRQASRSDMQERRQWRIRRGEVFGGDRSDVREFAVFPPFFHEEPALSVVIGPQIAAADDGHPVHPCGHVRQKLADIHAGHGGVDLAERTSVLRAWLWIESLKLAEAALQVNLK